ncbi:MAG TPA: CtsR family transcriptional regulator [Firmicutes bacterium]|nr:CtsR family transcriptional regulator [Bacillota bacterium]
MRSLSDLIEQYLREQLKKVETLEIQRRELARMFRCVPSQINYVLETRFTINHGFLVQSRRGGGGFIRITRLNWEPGEEFSEILEELLEIGVSQEEAELILKRLIQTAVLEYEEAVLLNQVLQDVLINEAERNGLGGEEQNQLRARVLRALLLFVSGRAHAR